VGLLTKDGFFRASSTLPSDTLMTKVIVLKNDYLADSASIRLPLSETTVTTDQRGSERLPFTCVGAYELDDKERDTIDIHAEDTICFGVSRQFAEWNIRNT
jgi:hypothetical protein